MTEEQRTADGAVAPPIISVGADVDVQALVEEVQAEVARKLEAGVYPPELMREVNQDRLGMAVMALRDSAVFSSEPPVGSGRARFAGAVSMAKRVIATALGWHTRWLVDQMFTFGANTVAATTVLLDRVHDHDVALADLRSRLAQPREPQGLETSAPRGRQLERELDQLRHESRSHGSIQDATGRRATYLDLFRQLPGRVVDLGCGRGEFLDLLKAAGVTAYGVDSNDVMVSACRERGLDARREDILEHLAGLPEESLGGIFCAQVIERLEPTGVIRFFELAWSALGQGGVLVVETLSQRSLATFTDAPHVDLGHLRPLHPLTLTFLAESAGFRDIAIRYSSPVPGGDRLEELPVPDDAGLRPLVSVMNENLRRIDETLFGPQDFAVVARR